MRRRLGGQRRRLDGGDRDHRHRRHRHGRRHGHGLEHRHDRTTQSQSLADCTELTELSTKFTQALGAATSGSGAPDLEETAKAYEEFADDVPEEVRDAFQTVAAAFTTYAEVLKDVDLGSGETPDPETLAKLAEAATALNDTELTAASAEIAAWATKNCSSR